MREKKQKDNDKEAKALLEKSNMIKTQVKDILNDIVDFAKKIEDNKYKKMELK